MGLIIKHPDPIMRRNLSDRMWKGLDPFNAIPNSALLVDDGFNLGVNRLSNRIRRVTGCSRNTLIYGTLATGAVADFSLLNIAERVDTLTNMVLVAFFGATSYIFGRLLVKLSNKEHSLSGEPVLIPEESLQQPVSSVTALRIVILGISMFDIFRGVLSDSSGKLIAASALFFFAISTHIASITNGTIDRLKDFLKEARGEPVTTAPTDTG